MRYCTRSILNFSFFTIFYPWAVFSFSSFSFSRLLLGVVFCFFLFLVACLLPIVSLSSLTLYFAVFVIGLSPSRLLYCLSVCPSVRAKQYFISSRSTNRTNCRRRKGRNGEEEMAKRGVDEIFLALPKKPLDSVIFFIFIFCVCTGRVPDPTSLFLPTSFCM